MKGTTHAEMMGRVVLVAELMERHVSDIVYKSCNISWTIRDNPRPRAGWIVGVRFVQEGLIHGAWSNGDDGDAAHLEITKTIPVYQVSYWPTMKPVLVPFSGIHRAAEIEPVSPSKWSWMTTSEEEKKRYIEFLKEEMSKAPRDSKGRWT